MSTDTHRDTDFRWSKIPRPGGMELGSAEGVRFICLYAYTARIRDNVDFNVSTGGLDTTTYHATMMLDVIMCGCSN